MTEAKGPNSKRKKEKKSFWFEYAKQKGVDPHKSAWRKFEDDKKENQDRKIRYCNKCGASVQPDGKFCERCGHRIQLRK
ncbi:MAG: zinc-ribbon domain-containing protein [Candidatus Heimdallarchaeota archaeon]|nr:MAG: zinc-ribbon domain-containing protein [Candidatus Heimdallarchaeota archaeon]